MDTELSTRSLCRIPYPPSTGKTASKGSAVNGIAPNAMSNGNGTAGHEPHVNGVNGTEDSESDLPDITEMKLEFEASSDQYGRITLYSIEVLA